jgi:hypothetical protein
LHDNGCCHWLLMPHGACRDIGVLLLLVLLVVVVLALAMPAPPTSTTTTSSTSGSSTNVSASVMRHQQPMTATVVMPSCRGWVQLARLLLLNRRLQ